MSRHLVILAGSPRGGIKTWKSLEKYVLNPLNADLAICYGDKFSNNKTKFLEDNAKYKWIFDEPNNWRKYYEDNFKGNWENFFLKGIEFGLAGGIDDYRGSGAIVFGLKDFIKRHFIDDIKKYDYIIYTRFDQYYIDSIPKLKNNMLNIPEGEDYGGVCDRFIGLSVKDIEEYLSICNYIDDKEYEENFGIIPNCEGVHLAYLKKTGLENKINRIPRNQFTVSLKNDVTRWRIGKYHYHFMNLYFKYPDEFIISYKNLKEKYNYLYLVKNKKIDSINYIYLSIRRILGKLKSSLYKGKK